MEGRQGKGWYHRGYLPHCDNPSRIQHITFHLYDSLPRFALERMEAQLQLNPDGEGSLERQLRLHSLLDQGYGDCLLRHGWAAKIVEHSFLHGHSARYQLFAWVVMPNHVHVLIQTLQGWALGKVVQSWKRYTAREIRKHLLHHDTHGSPSCTRQNFNKGKPTKTPFWQRDFWDRYIRDDAHFHRVVRYIENNPVKAGLVRRAEDWPWGSARYWGSR